MSGGTAAFERMRGHMIRCRDGMGMYQHPTVRNGHVVAMTYTCPCGWASWQAIPRG